MTTPVENNGITTWARRPTSEEVVAILSKLKRTDTVIRVPVLVASAATLAAGRKAAKPTRSARCGHRRLRILRFSKWLFVSYGRSSPPRRQSYRPWNQPLESTGDRLGL